jgi:AcrR family transcriptional regulator
MDVGQPEIRKRLDRRTWAVAALEALAENGPAGVAVEPIARRLGATKGSFYWHFADRRALLVAALELYEQEGTEAVIAGLRSEASALEEIRSLTAFVFSAANDDPVLLSLLAHTDDPDIAVVLARTTRRRIGYLVDAIERMGFSAQEAYQRGVLAYTTWLGLLEAERAVGGKLFPTAKARRQYVEFLERLLLS